MQQKQIMFKQLLSVFKTMPGWVKITLAFFIVISAVPAIAYSWLVVFSMMMNKYDLIDLTHNNCVTKTEFLRYHDASKKYYEYLAMNSYSAMGNKMRYTELQLDLIAKDIIYTTSAYTNAKYAAAIAIESQADIANCMYIFKSEMKAISRDDFKNVDIDIYDPDEVLQYCNDKSESGFLKGSKSISEHYSNSNVSMVELKFQIMPLVPTFKRRIFDSYMHSIEVQKYCEIDLMRLKKQYENSIPFKN
jgi:hypothetical protein